MENQVTIRWTKADDILIQQSPQVRHNSPQANREYTAAVVVTCELRKRSIAIVDLTSWIEQLRLLSGLRRAAIEGALPTVRRELHQIRANVGGEGHSEDRNPPWMTW